MVCNRLSGRLFCAEAPAVKETMLATTNNPTDLFIFLLLSNRSRSRWYLAKVLRVDQTGSRLQVTSGRHHTTSLALAQHRWTRFDTEAYDLAQSDIRVTVFSRLLKEKHP
jgi:hypothetical protein